MPQDRRHDRDGNEDAASLRDTTRISTHGSPILAASSFPSQWLSAGCRDCVALRELIAEWHRLAPSVRDAVMDLVRGRV